MTAWLVQWSDPETTLFFVLSILVEVEIVLGSSCNSACMITGLTLNFMHDGLEISLMYLKFALNDYRVISNYTNLPA